MKTAPIKKDHNKPELQNTCNPQQELQDFAYIVSHDLTAPARHVKQFTEILCSRLEGKLEPEEKEFAAILLKSASHMQNMLSSLLTYSRVFTTEKKVCPLDMNTLVESVTTSVQNSMNDRQASITVDDLPPVAADKAQVAQVLEELIRNALKFHNKDAPIQISITAESLKNGFRQFNISDNGIGVPDNQHEKAFQLFRQLNGKDYPGLGAGLHICRKIIETHGGRMWIAEPLSSGTTVAFTLPAAQ